ncbi:MAG: chromosome segregation protein SMC [Armatimonadetes bacterium]|nr:chromosome segregation protein SMC [Armatimonadota bacterium]
MLLKRLELQGFKTFADRTTLEFGPGITAIVGPNGSGKSNLFDAVRWVLGETSWRALRTNRMEDVIFAGSANRRAHGLAQIDLTIDNESGVLPVDYSEVTVSRRMTRAAEGEYFLNKTPCRLRDIQMMFLGTGLGGRSYAMISQGEVEAALDATPAERRVLLEEAAGLARYKRRRHEAERRLLHTQQNLVRIRDLIGEIEARRDALAHQAEVAVRYRELSTALRHAELAMKIEEARRMSTQRRRVLTQIETARQKRVEVETCARTLGHELSDARRRAQETSRALEAAQRELVAAVEQLGAAESKAGQIGERLRGLDERLVRAAAERAQSDDERGKLAAALETLRAEVTQTASEAAALGAAAIATQARAEEAARAQLETESALEGLRGDYLELQHARAQTQNERTAHSGRRSALEQRRAATEAQIARLRAERVAAEARSLTLEQELAAAAGEVSGIRTRVEQLRSRGQELAAELDEVRAHERRLAMDRQMAAARLQYLEEAQAQLLGYEQGAREILLARRSSPDRFSGLHGALVELIDVDREHRAAIESALGWRLFALVTDTSGDARAMLQFLREEGTAAGTFLPLDLVASAASVESDRRGAAAEGEGVRGVAADFVRAHEVVAAYVATNLSDAIVVRTLDDALSLRAAAPGARFVTLSGEMLLPDGTLIGGRRSDNAPLGRYQEIESLHRATADLDARQSEHHRREQALADALTRGRVEADHLTESLRAYETRAAALQRELALVSEDLQRRPQLEAALADDLESLQRESAEAGSLEDRLAESLAQLEAEVGRVEADAAAVRQRLADAHTARLALDAELVGLRVRQAEAEAALTGLRTRAVEREAESILVDARLADLDAERGGLTEEIERLRVDREATAAEVARWSSAEGASRQEIARLEEDRQRIEASLGEREVEAEQAWTAVREAEEAVHRLELRGAQIEAELAAARRRIEEEHGLSYEDADAQVPQALDREAVAAEVAALRAEVDALGPVNLRAINEHAEAERRHATLHAQAEDLSSASERLVDLIQRLERILQVRFEETFAEVQREFADCFKRLFGGGQGTLQLVVDDDGVEGVEILAEPPGKKLRTLASLSGGERAMTALSLVFALLRVHPSPFCVFDEVEAALDEANTRRVAELFRELSQKTQIIIITHNKATMEAANVLYGVTMKDPGTSSIVSVRMRAPQAANEREREHEPAGVSL